MPLVDFHTGGAGLDRAADALAKYSEPLLRSVAARLFRPRTTWPAEEVRDRLLAALKDPVLIDRTLRALSPRARQLLRLVGVSRQPLWRVRGLLDLLRSLGHEDGIETVNELLTVGLLYPALPPKAVPLSSFDGWLQQLTTQPLFAFTVPLAAGRAKDEPLQLHELPAVSLTKPALRESDGLEWPLRLAAFWQTVKAAPLRQTQQGGFFKRDLDRLRGHLLLAAPSADAVGTIPDPDLLGLLLAVEEEIVLPDGEQITAGTLPKAWEQGKMAAGASLFAALPGLSVWDPVEGWTEDPAAGRWIGPLAVILISWLAGAADRWFPVDDLAVAASGRTDASPAVAEALLLGLLYELGLVQFAAHKEARHVRLTELGRVLAEGAKKLPADPPAANQTLLVQPTLEIVLFRQGLTPALVARLSHFASWKTLGLACTLQLTAESVYHGLEDGETLNDLVALFQRHGTRELSETVLGTLRSWASKRERVLVYPSGLLLEFANAGELDRAVGLGLVERRVTDRIGLIPTEDRIDYGQFRFVGTRDYLAPEEQCVEINGDGLTIIVNANRSDLLLDSEVRRFAEPMQRTSDDRPQYRMTPQTLREARGRGVDETYLDDWFARRGGRPLPSAARLLLTGDAIAPATLQRVVVLRLPSPEVAEGILAWPETRGLVAERLSPTVLAVDADAVEALKEKLARIGVRIDD
jgi:hypothetical protein